MRHAKRVIGRLGVLVLLFSGAPSGGLPAAERLVGIYSARVMSQSMPWIAQEAGLFQKHNLDFRLVYIASSGMVTAAMLGGDAEVCLTGGVGNVRAYVQGATDLVFIGNVKNIMTQSILAGGAIKKPTDLKGKKIGVTRIGSNTHYFTIQALRRAGLNPDRDITFIQTGGEFETLAALIKGAIHAATMTAPGDAKAIAQGFHYVVYGPELRIPYAATTFGTRRSIINRRPQAVGAFMRAMAEAAKILHTDREFTYRVLARQLRVDDRKILDAAYNAEIRALEPRMEIRVEALQATLDEISQIDARAKNVKPEELFDRRYLDEMEASGFFDRLWGKDGRKDAREFIGK
ncbi:MAG TPA: ABC transporter substrate-binding protein [candidate division Zixibacteria bacterium]|nr:ABC transporter substrate-binding protein [candidate division Zixibacteria bacterium]